MNKAIWLGCFFVMGCFPIADTSDLPSIDDYESWNRVDAIGPVGGHGNSFRKIYVNDIAQDYAGLGEYRVGSTVVKEVRGISEEDEPLDLRYLAVARKLNEAPPGGTLENGWLFTYVKEAGTEEQNRTSCFGSCHLSAPFDHLFLDYGEVPFSGFGSDQE